LVSSLLDFSPEKQEVAMLVELSMVEQRSRVVREVLVTGVTITDVAARYGVDRPTLRRCLTRYASGDLEALATPSSKPATSPTQMDPVIEARLVSLRRSHPGWGLRTLATKMHLEFDYAPSGCCLAALLTTPIELLHSLKSTAIGEVLSRVIHHH
jgi:transposase